MVDQDGRTKSYQYLCVYLKKINKNQGLDQLHHLILTTVKQQHDK